MAQFTQEYTHLGKEHYVTFNTNNVMSMEKNEAIVDGVDMSYVKIVTSNGAIFYLWGSVAVQAWEAVIPI